MTRRQHANKFRWTASMRTLEPRHDPLRECMASVLPLRARACGAAAAPHPFAQQHLKLFRPSKFGSERSGSGPRV